MAMDEKVRKIHPYHDSTAEWLRKNPRALAALAASQRNHITAVRELSVQRAEYWLAFCKAGNAPKGVLTECELTLKSARAALQRSLDN